MKTLVVGDLHTKYHIFEKVRQASKDYDKIIFMGDYVDDWDVPAEASHNILIGLKEFYEENIGKVVLLLGNHDLSEWLGNEFRCAGFNKFSHLLVNGFMARFGSIFELAHAEQGFLFTHAGITEAWFRKYLGTTLPTPGMIANNLNFALNHWEGDDRAEQTFLGLSGVGTGRGGWDIPSPIWTDLNELLKDPVPELNQIVGHTPTVSCMNFQSYGAELWFCDTHSLYSNREPIGDNSFLEIEDGKVSKIYL